MFVIFNIIPLYEMIKVEKMGDHTPPTLRGTGDHPISIYRNLLYFQKRGD